VYAAKNTNEKIRLSSSSGGVFTLIAEKIIEENGVVFGAKFNDKWEVIHSYCETIEDLNWFRGSKYVQSIVGNTFIEVEHFLQEGRTVLYTGTPCQIAGLKLFLGKEYDHLLLVDFICHGVPSPLVWRKYLSELKQKFSKKSNSDIKIQNISFRDKEKGWKNFSLLINMQLFQKKNTTNIRFSETLHKNLFLKGFLIDLYLRPSCHQCPSKSLKSGSDITIADYWGVNQIHLEMDDDKGVSLVLLNTILGENIFSSVNIEKISTDYGIAVKNNPAILQSIKENRNRKHFFSEFIHKPFLLILPKYVNRSILKNSIDKMYQIKNKIKNSFGL
jgi:coenzyme F420-reducing hydrogenase beta subunit